MPQLDPTWFASQLFWLIVTFMALYVVLARFMLPPLMEIMERRKNTLASDVANAKLSKDAAEQAKDEYEKALAQARAKSQQLIDSVMAEHKTKSEQAMKVLHEDIAAKIKDAEQKITAKKKALIESLGASTEEIASLIVQKVAEFSPSADQVKQALSQRKG